MTVRLVPWITVKFVRALRYFLTCFLFSLSYSLAFSIIFLPVWRLTSNGGCMVNIWINCSGGLLTTWHHLCLMHMHIGLLLLLLLHVVAQSTCCVMCNSFITVIWLRHILMLYLPCTCTNKKASLSPTQFAEGQAKKIQRGAVCKFILRKTTATRIYDFLLQKH